MNAEKKSQAGISVRRVLAGVLFQMAAMVAHAAPLPTSARPIQIDVREMPVSKLLTDILNEQGVAAIVSDGITGSITARFDAPVAKIVDDVVRQFGLVWYYDGLNTVYITRASESVSRLLWMQGDEMQQLQHFMNVMQVADSRFVFNASPADGYVQLAGPPRYIQRVLDLARFVRRSPERQAKLVRTRVFRLKYAPAADSPAGPGIAQILARLVGAQALPGAGIGREPNSSGTATRAEGRLARLERESAVRQPGAESMLPLPDSEGGDRRNFGQRGSGTSASIGPRAGADLPPVPPEVMDGKAPQNAGSSGMRLDYQMGDAQRRRPRNEADMEESETLFETFTGPVVMVEPRLNAIIVRDEERRMKLYEELIAQLDVEPRMVEIEATIIDANSSQLEQLGFDWRLRGNRFDVLASPSGRGVELSPPATSAGSGLVMTTLIGSQTEFLMSRVQALAEKGEARIVSRPRVLTVDNQPGALSNTNEFNVRVAGERQADLFTVAYGLNLRVTPTIVGTEDQPSVRLTVNISDGSTTGVTVDGVPAVTRNAINTQGVISQGQSLLIGGYVVDQQENANSKVPYLGDIPVIGWLFGQKRETSRRTERLFLITPRILKVGSASPPAIDPPAQSYSLKLARSLARTQYSD
ncbi:type III secretion protein C [Noviherbaspirillum humi]|uniref:Type 3 secretion system secretin n=1 Tax=Noviherbaspirillum humi TaxID=1688639 RepID=A0A239JZU4_9BURK|nr:type III secretion system outer membrane ring subunit SctC [Noviherbaspirillum humi]SNT10304.1 type III secretion protein C [Noviherbaspirillum humi]